MSHWTEKVRKSLELKYSCAKRIGISCQIVPVKKFNFHVFNIKVLGNDDSIYAQNRQIWEALPRGTSIVYDDGGNLVATVQGLRKFGYLEDRKKLCYGDYDKVKFMILLEKENGENAQVSAFRYKGQRFWLVGSKNVHMIFQDKSDVLENEEYNESLKFRFAKKIALLVLEKYSQNPEFQEWLADNKYTAVGEAIFKDSQHIVDYGDQEDHIRFFAVSSDSCSFGNLTALPVGLAIEKFKSFGLPVPWMSEEVNLGSSSYYDLLDQISKKTNSEGCVGYLTDKSKHENNQEDCKVQYMCKIKSVNYVLERVVRGARKNGAVRIRNVVEDSIRKIFNNSDIANEWVKNRLNFLIDFCSWLSVTRKDVDNQQIMAEWLTLQHEFKNLTNQDWRSLQVPDSPTTVVAARGLPCSGKSSALRSLQYILNHFHLTAYWLNQDEIGKRQQYVKAFENALDSKPAYILLDKCNRDPQNLQDIYDVLNGPLHVVLNFSHPDDEDDSDIGNAVKVCIGRFQARGDSHRSLRSDANIEQILGVFKKQFMNDQKLSHYASTTAKIDMTLERDEMLRECTKAILPQELYENVDDKLIQQAVNYSLEYEDLLREQPDHRYGYFAIFFKTIDVQSWIRNLPPNAISFKKLADTFHVTLSYHGGFVKPKEYLAMYDLAKKEKKVEVRVKSLVYDEKAVTARVIISDNSIPCTNIDPHITVALAEDIPPVYSNELLSKKNVNEVVFPTEIRLEGTVRGAMEIKFNTKKDNFTAKLPKVIQPKSNKIAVDIGNVIYFSQRGSGSGDHIIEKNTVEIPNAIRSIRKIKNEGYELFLLSYCGEDTEIKTRQRLIKDGVDEIVPEEKWLFCRERSLKPVLMKQFGITLLIDDRPDTCGEVKKQGMEAIVFGQGKIKSWLQVLQSLNLERN